MKHRGERRMRWGEGWLIAVALVVVLTFSFVVCAVRVPSEVMVEPIHTVDLDVLRRVEMVNLNTASVEELSGLPGVGQILAERIVDWREKNGSFASVEELLSVEGIGEGKLEAIRKEIYVD